MRLPALLGLVLFPVCATACFNMRGSGADNVTLSVAAPADSVLRIATTQLELHGYEVSRLDDQVIVTRPRAMPNYLIEVSTARNERAGNEWMVRVSAEPLEFIGGTRVTVRGYVLPRVRQVSAGNSASERAIPVTDDNPQLFREIEVIADWIDAAAQRSRAEKR
ncbi:MAG TPA: hypothetical protein VNA89_10585 [Gemmatimonadaceae bacterium]|nr:hypothetical protein [Gemmatimonadaceae bacterium]